ncbi:hypothetical protein CTI12_AA166090 [Artemisia annua]|uniref:Uncharacterized protein n=1 Tax=Artemisia annua TaxID=35608 RepID=A0A2U1PCV9_ARTAN|nr:hypothetical protein CTI12_AA166090 [Artemisia annua]
MELRSGLEIDANLVLSESYIKKLQIIAMILQDLNLEFDGLNTEYKDLEVVLAQTAMKGSERRIHMGRKREVKHGIKRLEKLMKTVASTQTALQLLFSEMPHVEAVILILGGSPGRPRHVYEVAFSHGPGVRSDPSDFTRTRVAEGISRKVIRTLVSKGAGSDSYAGPSRLFLLVKAHSSFNMPQHFLPKRDFRYNKKTFVQDREVQCVEGDSSWIFWWWKEGLHRHIRGLEIDKDDQTKEETVNEGDASDGSLVFTGSDTSTEQQIESSSPRYDSDADGTHMNEVVWDTEDDHIRPSFDTEILTTVQHSNDNDNVVVFDNVFAHDQTHPAHPESVSDTYMVEQNDSNITLATPGWIFL